MTTTSLTDGRRFDADSPTWSSPGVRSPTIPTNPTPTTSLTTTADSVDSAASQALRFSFTPTQNSGFNVSFDTITNKILAKKGNRAYEVEVINTDITNLIKNDGSDKTELYDLIAKVATFLDSTGLLGQSASVAIDKDGVNANSIVTNGNQLNNVTQELAASISNTKVEFQEEYRKFLLNPLNPVFSSGLILKMNSFKIDNYGLGDCGPLSLADQEYQIDNNKKNEDHLKPGSTRNAQQAIRKKCAEKLDSILDKFNVESDKPLNLTLQEKIILETVFNCLLDESTAGQLKDIRVTKASNAIGSIQGDQIITASEIANIVTNTPTLEKHKLHIVHQLPREVQVKLLQYRAEYFFQNSKWVTDDFFETYAQCSNQNIVLIVEGENGVPFIKNIYTAEPESERTLFIYNNAKLKKDGTSVTGKKISAGSHYESINRTGEDFSKFIGSLYLRHERDLIDQFINSLKDNNETAKQKAFENLPSRTQTVVTDILGKNFWDATSEDLNKLTVYAITKKINEIDNNFIISESLQQLSKLPLRPAQSIPASITDPASTLPPTGSRTTTPSTSPSTTPTTPSRSTSSTSLVTTSTDLDDTTNKYINDFLNAFTKELTKRDDSSSTLDNNLADKEERLGLINAQLKILGNEQTTVLRAIENILEDSGITTSLKHTSGKVFDSTLDLAYIRLKDMIADKRLTLETIKSKMTRVRSSTPDSTRRSVSVTSNVSAVSSRTTKTKLEADDLVHTQALYTALAPSTYTDPQDQLKAVNDALSKLNNSNPNAIKAIENIINANIDKHQRKVTLCPYSTLTNFNPAYRALLDFVDSSKKIDKKLSTEAINAAMLAIT